MNKVYLGDCLDILKTLGDNTVDSIVTDPPYELGFMGKSWDNTGIANNPVMWAECLRVLKPGGHLLSFGGTRTYHRMAAAIEDAGFEVRDMIEWVYGSGFPKSLNIGKAVDKLQGNEREVVGTKMSMQPPEGELKTKFGFNTKFEPAEIDLTKGTSEWEGWGTALKPAHEPVIVSMKPLQIEQIFAIIIDNIWKHLPALDAINNLRDTQATLNEVVNSVPENVRINFLENIDNVEFAETLTTSLATKSKKEKESFAQENVALSGEKLSQEIKTHTGEVEDVSLVDISTSVQMGDISESIVLLWKNLSEELLNQTNTLTTRMAIKKIIELKTLRSCLIQNTGINTGHSTKIPPAHEPICMARKPLAEKTVAENVLKYGTGGINIDESRVGTEEIKTSGGRTAYEQEDKKKQGIMGRLKDFEPLNTTHTGRFPANLIHDNSEEVRDCFPESKGGAFPKTHGSSGFVLPEEKESRVEMNDSGNASRFFKSIIYQAKASKSERNKGLDSIVLVDILRVWNENNTTKEEKLIRLMVTGISPQRVIAESGVQLKNANEWNTYLFGKHLMEKYQEDIKSITKTETNSITTSQISNWLTHLLTNEYIADVKSEMENGGNLVANVENSNTLIFTINEAMALALGVKDVVSGTQLKISVKEGSNIHSTVKPIALMEYLIKMVTPTSGTVLDPFAGSGSTLVAAKQNGFNYIGIEMTAEYIPIIEARLHETI